MHNLTLSLSVAGFIAAGLVANGAIDGDRPVTRLGVERVAGTGGDGVRGGFAPFVAAGPAVALTVVAMR